jgi:DNA-binding NarL/FixJ family response regulator
MMTDTYNARKPAGHLPSAFMSNDQTNCPTHLAMASDAPARATARRKIRLLLADDHEVVRNGLARLLQMQGDFDVIGQASDGLMAIDQALLLKPDVIVMDVSMPRLDGIEATRRITAALPGVRVIGLSMHGHEDVAAAMAKAGASAYLPKTTAPEALIAAIRSHGGSSLLS